MKVAIVGSGPAGLMAAHFAALGGAEVEVFEKRSAYGRKLLIAGSSGLNISHHAPLNDFVGHYEGFNADFWEGLLTEFSPEVWVKWIETNLGLETFIGTSDRYFVREMKASNLLKRWQELLSRQGVKFHRGHELLDFATSENSIELYFKGDPQAKRFERAAFFLGGGSWEESPPAWPGLLHSKGLSVQPFRARNVGYELAWSPAFLKEAEGQPLKKICLTSVSGSKIGELVITNYGLEGTPIYFHGLVGEVFLDLKPDFTEEKIREKLLAVKENLSPLRRVKKVLGLGPAALALLFHHTTDATKSDLNLLVSAIKNFRLELLRPRPLLEAISSSGGLDLSEISPSFELKKFPGLFCAGEMLDWHSPTGGFLIQACVSQGARVGRALTLPESQ